MMFRFTCVIILLTAFLFQPLHTVYVYLDYELNKNYITLRYCENRKKPQLKCHGKCQAMKKLAAGEKQELPKSIASTSLELINFFEDASEFPHPVTEHQLVSIIGQSMPADGYTTALHRPPAA